MTDTLHALNRIADAIEKIATIAVAGIVEKKIIVQSSESEEARHTREYREGLVTREVILTNGLTIDITIDEERELIALNLLKTEERWQSVLAQADTITKLKRNLEAMQKKPKQIEGESIDG